MDVVKNFPAPYPASQRFSELRDRTFFGRAALLRRNGLMLTPPKVEKRSDMHLISPMRHMASVRG
jgi:hypothetical protein